MIKITVDGKLIDDVKDVVVTVTTAAPPPVEPPPAEPPPVEPPPVEPPPVEPPPDLGDAVPWESISGRYAFGERGSFQVITHIPSKGLYVYFTVPSVTSFGATFQCVEMRHLPCPLNFSISERVGDMIGLARKRLQSFDAQITGGYPTGRDCILYPNKTYFWNIKWERPASDHIYLAHAYKSPM